MLIINKNTTQTIVLTLTEKSTLTSPHYLFSFTNDITHNMVNFLAADVSTAQERYNEFYVTETSGSTNYSSGTITLSPTGTWSYRVFEQLSSSNLNPLLADNQEPVEVGQVRVIGTEVTYTGYSGQDNTIITYGTGS